MDGVLFQSRDGFTRLRTTEKLIRCHDSREAALALQHKQQQRNTARHSVSTEQLIQPAQSLNEPL